eukprot:XP_011677806.1 PREDICTED: uncharacterized protein LOC105444798 [Strongylocentrotus purpuratus]
MHLQRYVVCLIWIALIYSISLYEGADASNLSCYDCAVKFKQVYTQTDCVVNPRNSLMPRSCQEHEHFCTVDYTKVNRIFTRFVRNCASTCNPRCITRGFGLDEEVCTFCCNQDGCNLGNRGRQHTSSTTLNPFCCIIAMIIGIYISGNVPTQR